MNILNTCQPRKSPHSSRRLIWHPKSGAGGNPTLISLFSAIDEVAFSEVHFYGGRTDMPSIIGVN